MSPRHAVHHALPLALVIALACDQPAPTVLEPDAQANVVPKGSCLGASRKLEDIQKCVTLDAVRAHQAALAAVASSHFNRPSATPGHDASAQYVAGVLNGAGYQVTLQPVPVTAFLQLGPSRLNQVSPVPTTYVEGTDFNLMAWTAAGDVTAPVTGVDLALGSNVHTSGCEAADFAGFPAGHIALIQRGSCTFALKALNAFNAGASGVIIFNNFGSTGLVSGTLTPANAALIPVVSSTYDRGVEWATTPGLTMRIRTDVKSGTFTTHNVIAEATTGDAANVVMLGAHLDSSNGSPGINDNGSGAAALVEVAVQMAGVRTRNRLRFAFWSGHEQGLVGSTYYVNGLSTTELNDIALYIDAHMLGSPNFGRFVLDGDGSTFPFTGPDGSGAIESFFNNFYSGRGLVSEPTALAGNSDYGPFAAVGVPVGGVFAGSFGIKTPAQAAAYGGTAGLAYDPCYHLACDTFANVSLAALDVNSDAMAAAALAFAMNTEAVNGNKGKGNFRPKKLLSPASSTQDTQ